MFYAKGNMSQKIDIYLALLEKSISEGNHSNYWTFFLSAFEDAHKVATGVKTYFDVDNDRYDVVSMLVKNNHKYFEDLNVQQIDNKVFTDVKTFMKTLKQTNTQLNG